MLTKGAKAHQRKVSSARLIVYTAHFIRDGLDFQDRVPILSVLGLLLDMVRARVKFWYGTDGAMSFARLNLSVPNQFFWYAYFFHPSRAKNFLRCKWGLKLLSKTSYFASSLYPPFNLTPNAHEGEKYPSLTILFVLQILNSWKASPFLIPMDGQSEARNVYVYL